MSSFSLNLLWYLDHYLALQTFWQTSCSWCVWRNDSLLTWFAFLAVSPVPSGLPYYMWSARVYILFCFLHLDLVCWLIEGRLFASGNLPWATLMSLCSSQVFLNRWRISVLCVVVVNQLWCCHPGFISPSWLLELPELGSTCSVYMQAVAVSHCRLLPCLRWSLAVCCCRCHHSLANPGGPSTHSWFSEQTQGFWNSTALWGGVLF